MTKLTMALTGHRPQKLAGYDLQQPYYERMENQLIKLIKTALKRCDKLELHSGMALGGWHRLGKSHHQNAWPISWSDYIRCWYSRLESSKFMATWVTKSMAVSDDPNRWRKNVCTRMWWQVLCLYTESTKHRNGGHLWYPYCHLWRNSGWHTKRCTICEENKHLNPSYQAIDI